MGQVKHSLRKKKSHLNSFNNINIAKSLPKIKKELCHVRTILFSH